MSDPQSMVLLWCAVGRRIRLVQCNWPKSPFVVALKFLPSPPTDPYLLCAKKCLRFLTVLRYANYLNVGKFATNHSWLIAVVNSNVSGLEVRNVKRPF